MVINIITIVMISIVTSSSIAILFPGAGRPGSRRSAYEPQPRYIYIYIHLYRYMYIHIYIYREREREIYR